MSKYRIHKINEKKYQVQVKALWYWNTVYECQSPNKAKLKLQELDRESI